MALINCPECGKSRVSDAGTCPGCGFPIEKYFREEESKKRAEQYKDWQERGLCWRCGGEIEEVTKERTVVEKYLDSPYKYYWKCTKCGHSYYYFDPRKNTKKNKISALPKIEIDDNEPLVKLSAEDAAALEAFDRL